MLFNKKRDEKKLPDLPPSPLASAQIPASMSGRELDEDKSLPSFPDSPAHNKFSQAVIKDAVVDEDELPELPEANATPEDSEMDEWMPETPKSLEFPLPKIEKSRPPMRSEWQRGMAVKSRMSEGNNLSDVYVKIDKFHVARRTLDDISEKIEELDDMVKKIRETKLREEQELIGWERDVAHIKTRIQEVTSNIFEKIE